LFIERDIWKLSPPDPKEEGGEGFKETDVKPVRMPASQQRVFRFRICKGKGEEAGERGKEEKN
jgi:hypothetical protein